MKRLLISLILSLMASMPLLGMEKPEAPAMAGEILLHNRVSALTVLAARKCAHLFNPEYSYARSLKNLSKCQIPADVAVHIAMSLAADAAGPLEHILDEEIESLPINMGFDALRGTVNNLYADNFGICDDARKILIPHFDEKLKYMRVCLSDDKQWCATNEDNSYDTKLHIWDVATGNKIKTLQLILPAGQPEAFNLYAHYFSPDKKTLLASYFQEGSPARHYYCGFDILTGQKIYEERGWAVCKSHSGSFFFEMTRDHTEVHDTLTGQLQYIIPVPENTLFYVSPHDDYIISLTNNTLCVWDTQTGKCLHRITRNNGFATNALSCLSISKDGCLVADTSHKTITAWNPYTGKEVASIPHSLGKAINIACFSADNSKLITFNYHDRTLQIWDIARKKIVAEKQILLNEKDAAYAKKWGKGMLNFVLCEDDCIGMAHLDCSPFHLRLMLHPIFGKELTLRELSALLILEHNLQKDEPFNLDAYDIVANSTSPLLKKIFAQRYEMDAIDELELNTAQTKQWRLL